MIEFKALDGCRTESKGLTLRPGSGSVRQEATLPLRRTMRPTGREKAVIRVKQPSCTWKQTGVTKLTGELDASSVEHVTRNCWTRHSFGMRLGRCGRGFTGGSSETSSFVSFDGSGFENDHEHHGWTEINPLFKAASTIRESRPGTGPTFASRSRDKEYFSSIFKRRT